MLSAGAFHQNLEFLLCLSLDSTEGDSNTRNECKQFIWEVIPGRREMQKGDREEEEASSVLASYCGLCLQLDLTGGL